MELLEGETLAERLEHGPLPIDRALISAGQIATALDAAHRKGVIHRDLKPSNVMVTASGVKLLDFGLAKLREIEGAETLERSTKSLPLTQQGAVLGTIPYMAPEQVEGREADARTDVFALGVILYEMTTGRPPFEARSPASLLASILTHDPPPLSSVRPGVPAGVDRVVRKCLAKDPDERWQSAADLNAALQWSREDSASPHGPPHAIDKRRYFSRRVLAALAGGGGGRCAGGVDPHRPRHVRHRRRAAAVHSGHVPDRNRVRRPVRPGRRDHHLQCGLGRRQLRVVHDATRQS